MATSSKLIIQNPTTPVARSDRPSSKWWWSGAIRTAKRPDHRARLGGLNTHTCRNHRERFGHERRRPSAAGPEAGRFEQGHGAQGRPIAREPVVTHEHPGGMAVMGHGHPARCRP